MNLAEENYPAYVELFEFNTATTLFLLVSLIQYSEASALARRNLANYFS